MAQNITLLGASYSDVPSVLLPKTGGGTARFDDTTISSNAAAASDIASGKLAYVNGSLITGTASGGGGSGLVYETGTWTPTTDISSYNITFSNTHSTAPSIFVVADATGTYDGTTNSNYCIVGVYLYELFGNPMYSASNSAWYGRRFAVYRASATSFGSGGSTASSANGWTSFATNTEIVAYTASSSRYWRSGRTYKWIAVWSPTT